MLLENTICMLWLLDWWSATLMMVYHLMLNLLLNVVLRISQKSITWFWCFLIGCCWCTGAVSSGTFFVRALNKKYYSFSEWFEKIKWKSRYWLELFLFRVFGLGSFWIEMVFISYQLVISSRFHILLLSHFS